jgi:hypothetical protein
MGGDEIRLIFFLVIMVIGIFRAILKKASNQEPAANRPDPGRQQRVQSEIDAFLSEVGASRQQQQAPERRQPPQRPQAQPQARQQRPRPQRPARPARPVQQPQPVPQQSLRDRHLDSSIDDHVIEYLPDEPFDIVDSPVDELVEAHIVESVDSHLGDRAMEMPGGTRTHRSKPVAESLIQLLRSPEGVRQAILVNEVLSKPRILRK